MESVHKELHFCCIPKYSGYLAEKHLYSRLSCKLNYSFLSWISFLFKDQKRYKLWIFRFGYFRNIVKMNTCHFEENNWQQCLLSMIKFKLSRENLNFGKCVYITMSLPASQYLNTFLMRSVVLLINVIFVDIVSWNVSLFVRLV